MEINLNVYFKFQEPAFCGKREAYYILTTLKLNCANLLDGTSLFATLVRNIFVPQCTLVATYSSCPQLFVAASACASSSAHLRKVLLRGATSH